MKSFFLFGLIINGLMLTWGAEVQPLKHTASDGSTWEFKEIRVYYVNPKTGVVYLDQKNCLRFDCTPVYPGADEGVIVYRSPKGFRKIVKIYSDSEAKQQAGEFIKSCRSIAGVSSCSRQVVSVEPTLVNQSRPDPVEKGEAPVVENPKPIEKTKASFTGAWYCPYSLKKPYPANMPPTDRKFTVTLDKEKGCHLNEIDDFLRILSGSGYNYFQCVSGLFGRMQEKIYSGEQYRDFRRQCSIQIGRVLEKSTDLFGSKKDLAELMGEYSGNLNEVALPETVKGPNCHIPYDSHDSIYLSRQFIEDLLPKYETRLPKECKSSYIRMIFALLQQKLFKCDRSDNPTSCQKKISDLLPSVLSSIRKVVISQRGNDSYGFEEDLFCSSVSTDLDSALTALDRQLDIQACVSLKPGEKVKVINKRMPTIESPKYELERISRDQYRASIPVRFEPQSKDAEFRSRANDCLKKVSPFLKGPDGTSIQVGLLKSSPGQPDTNVIEAYDYRNCRSAQGVMQILEENSEALDEDSRADYLRGLQTILEPGQDPSFYRNKNCERANSAWWSNTLDCSTITHEVLHLLGLCDEYEEKWVGMRINPETGLPEDTETSPHPDYISSDCRIVNPGTSVMADQRLAFDALGLDAQGNPKSTSSIVTSKSSLLDPVHFNAIVYPGCKSKNDLYYRCMKYSYKSSWRMSRDVIEKVGCGDEKEIAECKAMFGGGGAR